MRRFQASLARRLLRTPGTDEIHLFYSLKFNTPERTSRAYVPLKKVSERI